MRLAALTAFGVFVLDQLTKWLVVWGLDLANRGAIDLVAPWLTFRMAWNRGINFGIGSSDQGDRALGPRDRLARHLGLGLALGLAQHAHAARADLGRAP